MKINLNSAKNPLVSIIILNYNAGDLLLRCVESVFNTDYENYEVIVVDNVSNDNSHKLCKEKFEKITLIENKQNYGYCEGNNIGIRNANGDFIVILNPDTKVDSKWLKELLVAYNKHGEGLYQPKILSMYQPEIIQSTGNMLHVFGFGFARDKGTKDLDQHTTIECIGYASGTCLFTSSTTLKKIGLFDSFLFLYHDDLDLGWRAAQIGIKSYYVPNAIIYHAESYTLKWSAKKFYWLERNRRYCLQTHYSKNTHAKMLPYLILVDVIVWFFYLTKGFLGSKIKAEIDLIKNKNKIIEKYTELEAKKVISDSELIESFPDDIFVPQNVSGMILSKSFNSVLSKLSKRAKNSVLATHDKPKTN
jgi:GT2 family glycosyltransferase